MLATREEMHRLVEQLDDESLPEALSLLLQLTSGDGRHGAGGSEADELDEDDVDNIGAPITADDSLWRIIGIGSSAEPTDVRNRKDEYLAEAYTPASRRA